LCLAVGWIGHVDLLLLAVLTNSHHSGTFDQVLS